MPNARLPMNHAREILRLSREKGMTGRAIAQKGGLRGERKLRTVWLDQPFALFMAQAIPDFFFNQANWVVNWPIS